MVDSTSQEFDIKRYLAVVYKRRYLAIAIALVIMTLATVGSYVWPKTYEANSTVFIERSSLMDPLIRGIGVSNSMEDRLRNLKNGITSRNIVDRVVKKLDLDISARKAGQHDELVRSIQDNLTVAVKTDSRERETDLFTISYKGTNPKTVRDVVNTLVSEFIEENVSFRRTDAYGAYEFIQNQLMEYKTKLEQSDKAIRDFRENNPRMVPQSETAVITNIERLQTGQMEAEIRLKELLRKQENLRKQISGEKELTIAFVTREGSPQARLNHLNNQLLILTGKYTDNYPEVIKVKSEIEDLKRQIAQSKTSGGESVGSETSAINPVYQQLKEELFKTDSEIESLRGRISELGRQKAESQHALGRMPKEQEEWVKLQRDRNVLQKLYDDLLQKLENAKVSKDLELTDKNATFRIVDPAVLPSFPLKPDRIKVILAGIFLGIAGGIGATVVLEFIDKSFKDEKSIESTLRVPVLASIPMVISETETIMTKQRDRKVFIAAGAYAGVVALILGIEVVSKAMGLKVIPF